MRSFTLYCTLLLCCINPAQAQTKTIYGYVEKATLTDQNVVLVAKLDTGAKSSSLHAIDIKKVIVDGKPYLRFTVPHPGGEAHFLSEYHGKVSIKARAQEIEHIKRPVVWMKVKLGSQEHTIRVNLTNRGNFMYPMLLGRQAIVAFYGVVDPSLKYEAHNQPTPKLESQ